MAQVTAVNVENFTMTDDRIAAINRELAEAFGRAASEAENVEFRAVSISSDTLTIDIRMDRRGQ